MQTEYCCEKCGGRGTLDSTNPLRPPCHCTGTRKNPRPRLVPVQEYEANRAEEQSR